jgi:ribose 5-phosphate isomerase A
MPDQETLKHEAAEQALAYVEEGMILGLGTGTTAQHMITVLGQRVADGLRVRAVASSERSAAQARNLGIEVITLDDVARLDVTIDGADEIDLSTFGLIKGGGGALLREKIVARASKLLIIVADETKVVPRLGVHMPLPVEVVPFGWRQTAQALAALGLTPSLRWTAQHDMPYLTDGGHYILDCACEPLAGPAAMELEQAIKAITGVVECGLFLGLAGRIIVAGAAGVRVYEQPVPAPPGAAGEQEDE